MPNGSITSGIGNRLRDARLARGLSIEEVAWRTRIRPEYLRALEHEDFAGLGHHAFVRTHLRSYAALLGLDASEVEGTFRDNHEPAEPSSLQTLHRRQRDARRQRPKLSWLRAAIVAAVALAIAASVGVLRGPGSQPTAGVSLPDLPRRNAEPGGASREARLDRPVRVAGEEVASVAVRLEVVALRDVRVRVVGDGQLLFDGVLTAGSARAFTASDRIDVQTSEVSSLRMVFADEPYDPGVRGSWTGSFGPAGPLAPR